MELSGICSPPYRATDSEGRVAERNEASVKIHRKSGEPDVSSLDHAWADDDDLGYSDLGVFTKGTG